VRQRYRSNVLKELARERALKRSRAELDEEEEEGEMNDEHEVKSNRSQGDSLLSILPRPKSTVEPTVRLESLLKMPERAEASQLGSSSSGMTEANLTSRTLRSASPPRSVHLKSRGKEKQKNQITYLAELGKATELERKEQAAQGRLNKAAARSKYGW